MRKTKILGFLLVIIGILAYLGMSIASKLEHKEIVKTNISKWKEISYKGVDGTNNSPINSIKPKIIFFFNTECQHCQAEAKLVAQNQEKFNNAEVYFFSTEDLEAIKEFAEEYGLESFRVGQVDFKSVAYPMGINTFPMCFIYSKEGRLLKQFKGEVKIDALLHYIE